MEEGIPSHIETKLINLEKRVKEEGVRKPLDDNYQRKLAEIRNMNDENEQNTAILSLVNEYLAP